MTPSPNQERCCPVDHKVSWAGDGYFCEICGIQFSHTQNHSTMEGDWMNNRGSNGPVPMPRMEARDLNDLIEQFEENFRDHGDERYGYVKHNNTQLERQCDWLNDRLNSFLAKERESAERSGREQAVTEIVEKYGYFNDQCNGRPLSFYLTPHSEHEAARKDTEA